MRVENEAGIKGKVLEKEVLENHKRYLERKKLYARYGFDIDKERRSVLAKAEPVFGDVLEIGTGKGHFALVLAGEGYKFTSVDIAEEEQKIARLNLRYAGLEDYVYFRVENAEKMSFNDKSFDTIFSINTVHHLKKPFKVMDEISRVLTLDGKIVLSDFTDAGFGVLDKIHASEGRAHSKAGVELDDISRYFAGKGFSTEESRSKFQRILIAYRQVV